MLRKFLFRDAQEVGAEIESAVASKFDQLAAPASDVFGIRFLFPCRQSGLPLHSRPLFADSRFGAS
jgi:hypothetical protein